MKKTFLLLIVMAICSCTNESRIKSEITDAIEVHDGIRTDCNVDISNIEITDWKVKDSLKVLNDKNEIRNSRSLSLYATFGKLDKQKEEYKKMDENLVLCRLVKADVKFNDVFNKRREVRGKFIFDKEEDKLIKMAGIEK